MDLDFARRLGRSTTPLSLSPCLSVLRCTPKGSLTLWLGNRLWNSLAAEKGHRRYKYRNVVERGRQWSNIEEEKGSAAV